MLRRSVLALAALGLMVLPMAAAKAQDLPKGEEIIAKYIDAIGGREKLESLTSMQMSGSFSMPAQGINAKMNVVSVFPGKFFVTINIPGLGEIKQGCDGETAWEINPLTGSRILEGKEFEQAQMQASVARELDLEANFESVECTGEEDFAGKACYVVKQVSKGGLEQTVYYEKESGLVAGSKMTVESPQGAIDTESTIDDYLEIDGVKMPKSVSAAMMGMKQVIEFDAVKFNVEVDESQFAVPEELAATASK